MSDRLQQLAVIAQLTQMTAEMNLNNNQRRLKQAELDAENRRWEQQFAYTKQKDQWAQDMREKELQLSEQEVYSEHGQNVKEDEKGNAFIDWKNYDYTLRPDWQKTLGQSYLDQKRDFEKNNPMISLTGNETEDREIMANFYSGVYAGKMQANSFIVDTDLYMDVEKNYYQGADIVSQDYLGSKLYRSFI